MAGSLGNIQLKFEISGTVLWQRSSFLEAISLKEAVSKSILVKDLENEEKNIYNVIPEDFYFNLDIDDCANLAKLP